MERYSVDAADFLVKKVGTVQFSDTAFTNCALPSILNGLKTAESLLALNNRDGLIVNVAARDGDERGLYLSETSAVIDLLIQTKREHEESGQSGAVADAVAEETVFHFISLASATQNPVTNLSFNVNQSLLAVIAIDQIVIYQTQQLIAVCKSPNSASTVQPVRRIDSIDQSPIVHSEWEDLSNRLFLLTAAGTICCCDASTGSIHRISFASQPSSSITSFTLLPSNYSTSADSTGCPIVIGTETGQLQICNIVDQTMQFIAEIDAHIPDEPPFTDQPRVHHLSSIHSSLILVGFQSGSDPSVDPDLTSLSLFDITTREWRDCGDLLDEETRFMQIRDGLSDDEKLQSNTTAPYPARHHYHSLSLLKQPWQMSLIFSNRSENLNILGPPISFDSADSSSAEFMSWQRWDMDDPLLVPTDSNFDDAYVLGAGFDLSNKALPIPGTKSPMPVVFMLTSDGRLHANSFVLGNDDDHKAKASAAIMHPAFSSSTVSQQKSADASKSISLAPAAVFTLPSLAVSAQPQQPVSVKPMLPQAPAAVTPAPFAFSAPPSTDAQSAPFGSFSFPAPPAASSVKPAAPAPFSFSSMSSTAKSTSEPSSLPVSKPFGFGAPSASSSQAAFSFASSPSTTSTQPPVSRSLFDSKSSSGSTSSTTLFGNPPSTAALSSSTAAPSNQVFLFAAPASSPKPQAFVTENAVPRASSQSSPTLFTQPQQSYKQAPAATASPDPFDRASHRITVSAPSVPPIPQTVTTSVNVRSTLQPSDFDSQAKKPSEAIIQEALHQLAERMRDLNSIQQQSKETLRRLATPALRSGHHSQDDEDEFSVNKLYAISSSVRDLTCALQPVLDTQACLPTEIDKINSSIVQIREQLEQAQKLRDSLGDPAVASMIAAMPLDADAAAKLANINRRSLWLTQKLDELDVYLADRWALVRSELGLGGTAQPKMRSLQDVHSLIESHQRLIQTQQEEVERLERQIEEMDQSPIQSNSLLISSDVPAVALPVVKDEQHSHLLFDNDRLTGRRQIAVVQSSPDRARARSTAINTPIIASHLQRANGAAAVTPQSKRQQPINFPRPPPTPVSVALPSDAIQRLTATFNEKVALSTGKQHSLQTSQSLNQGKDSAQSKELIHSLLNQADAPHFQQQAYLHPLPSTELLNSAAKNQSTPGSSRRWARSKQSAQPLVSPSVASAAPVAAAANDERLVNLTDSIDQAAVQRMYEQRVDGIIEPPQPFVSFTLPKPTSSTSLPAPASISTVPSKPTSTAPLSTRHVVENKETSIQKAPNPFVAATSSQSFPTPAFGQSSSSLSFGPPVSSSTPAPAFSFGSLGAVTAQAKPAFSFSALPEPAVEKPSLFTESAKQPPETIAAPSTPKSVISEKPAFVLPPVSPLSPGAALPESHVTPVQSPVVTSIKPPVFTPIQSPYQHAEPGAKVDSPSMSAKAEKIAAPVIAPFSKGSASGFAFSGVVPTFSFGSASSTSTVSIPTFGSASTTPSFASGSAAAPDALTTAIPLKSSTSSDSTTAASSISSISNSTDAPIAATSIALPSSSSPSLPSSSSTSLSSSSSLSLSTSTEASTSVVGATSSTVSSSTASQSSSAPTSLFSFGSTTSSASAPAFGSSSSSSLFTNAAAASTTIANPFATQSSSTSGTTFGFGTTPATPAPLFAAASSSTASSASASIGFGSFGSALSTPAKDTNSNAGFGMGGLSFGGSPGAPAGNASLGVGIFGQSTGSSFGFGQSATTTDPFATAATPQAIGSLFNKPPAFGSSFTAPSLSDASSSMASESEPSPANAFGSSFSVTQISQPMSNPFAVTSSTPSFGMSAQTANPFATQQQAPPVATANPFAAAAPAANPFAVSNPAFGGGFGSSFSNSAFGGNNAFGSSMSAAPAPAFGQSFGSSAGFGSVAQNSGFAAAAPAAFGGSAATSGFGAVAQGGFGGFAQAAASVAPAQASGWGSRPFGQTSNVNFNTGAFRG